MSWHVLLIPTGLLALAAILWELIASTWEASE